MSGLEQTIRQLAEDGLQVNLWPTETGFQANVKERADQNWTTTRDADPVEALRKALWQRATGSHQRQVIGGCEAAGAGAQIDLEEAIAATCVPADPFEEMFG